MPDSTEDKLVICVDCGAQFSFSARDQAFYQERGYQAPRRCKPCRDKRKSGAVATPSFGGGAGSSHSAPQSAPAAGGAPARDQFKVQCSGCGVETTVPFKPDPTRPVFCRTCYLNSKKGAK